MSIKTAAQLKREWDATEPANFVISELRTMMRIGRRYTTTNCGVLHGDVKEVLRNAGYDVCDFKDEIGEMQTRVSLPD